MSKKKGMSLDQKCNAMLQFFHRKQEFFHMKELEKTIPKETGMPAQSVQDVLKSLVNDNLVDSEKIGTSSFYWAFPSKAKHMKKKELDSLKGRLEESNKKLKASREKIIASKVGREDTEKRQKLLQKIHTMKIEEERINSEIQKYKDSDPVTLEKWRKEIETAKVATNRWTDNIFNIQSYCVNKGCDRENFNKRYKLDDLDYVD